MKAKASEFDRLIGHLEKDILDRNLDRVKTLVDTYRSFRRLRLPLKGRSDAADILRAATVMLHATLEELLRGLAIARISFADASTLRHIPLFGQRKEE
jgi:hypothetical protein